MKKRSNPIKSPPTRKRSNPLAGNTISRRGFFAIAAALIMLSLGLRLIHLGSRQFWLDEAFSHYIATVPNWFSSVLIDNNPPLYYLLLRAWVWIAGTSELSFRLPSALAGTLFVALTIWAGSEIFNRPIGLWSGAVAALSPIQIYYSQEARVYELLGSFLILALILLWRAVASNSWRRWALFGAVLLAALYSHYLTPLALLPTVVLLLLMPEPGRRFRYIVTVTVSVLLFAPWLIGSFFWAPRPGVGTAWIEGVWSQTTKLFAIPLSLEIFGLGSQARLVPLWMHQFATIEFPPELRILGLILMVAVGLIVAMPQGDANLGIERMGLRKTWLIAILLCPLLVLWLISWVKPLYVVGRYDFLAYPAFPILVGLAFEKLRSSQGWPVAAVLAAVFLIPITAKLYFYYQAPETSKPRLTAQFLDSAVQDRDVVVFTGLRALPVLYYLSRAGNVWESGFCKDSLSGRSFCCRMYPRAAEQTPAAMPSQLPDSPELVRAELADYLSGFEARTGTFWVVLSGIMTTAKSDQLLLDELLHAGFVQVKDPAASDLLVIKLRKP